MAGTAIQLYTLRHLQRPMPELLEAVAAAGYEGVEFAGIPGTEAERAAVADALDDATLAAVGAHVGVETVEGDPAGTAETYGRLGCSELVIPYLGESQFESAEAAAATGAHLEELAHALSGTGARLHYHNHDHELRAVDGRTALDAMAAATEDLRLEIDLGWVAAGGADPAAFVRRHADRTELLHVTDVDGVGGSSAEVGEGIVDVDACLAAARDADVEWLVYEHDEPADPEASMRHGVEVLEDA